jgi:hypothetical protein
MTRDSKPLLNVAPPLRSEQAREQTRASTGAMRRPDEEASCLAEQGLQVSRKGILMKEAWE